MRVSGVLVAVLMVLGCGGVEPPPNDPTASEVFTLVGYHYQGTCMLRTSVEILQYTVPEFKNNGFECFINPDESVIVDAQSYLSDELARVGYHYCDTKESEILAGNGFCDQL